MEYPKTASIEVSNVCNYKCSKCFQGHSSFNKRKKFIELNLFREIIKRLPTHIRYIGLSGIGEPLTHPNFFSLVDICMEERPDCLTGFHTNGSLMSDSYIHELLRRDNIDDINISVDSISNKTHVAIHKSNCDLNNILLQIGKLVRCRNEMGSKLRITTSFVIQEENIDELVPFVLAMKGLGVDYIGPLNLINPLPGYDISNWENRKANIADELERTRQLGELCELNIDIPVWKHRRFGSANMEHVGHEACSFPFELYPIIDVYGDVFPCVWLQFEKDYKIGNILDDSIHEILYGQKIQKIRDTLLSGKYFSCCRNCNPGGILENVPDNRIVDL